MIFIREIEMNKTKLNLWKDQENNENNCEDILI
jgi:hypothetical protein